MKKTLPIVLLALACGLFPARSAEAQSGIIRWIEKLSGPGPYVAYGYELYPLCYGKNTGRRRHDASAGSAQQAVDQPSVFRGDLNCRGFSRSAPLLKIGFQYSAFQGDNQLQYDASVPSSLTDTVYGNIYAVTGDVTVAAGRFDLGGSLGAMHFTGTPTGSVLHPIFEFRGNINILPLFYPETVRSQNPPTEWYKRDWLQFRLSMNIVPGGLEDTDFGAIPGTFPRTDTEVSLRPAILVNLGSAFDW